MAICGPTGAGKTRSALRIASALGTRIAVIDTENRSASVYVGKPDVPDFDVLELETLAPRNYVDAISEAENEGYDVIIVDSLSHAWQSKDGALAMVDRAAKRSQSENTYTAWRDVTPEHEALVDKLLRCKAHIIVTMRSKMDYVLEDVKGKKVPRKVGMAPIQRSGMEYEFHITCDMDVDHNLCVTKTRFDSLDQVVVNRPGREFGVQMLEELAQGVAEVERPPAKAGAASTSRSAPASSQHSSAGSSARQTGTQRSTAATPSSTPSTDRALPTDAEGWRAAHNAVCDHLFQELGIESGPADEYGLHVPSTPMPSFSDQAKQHPGKAYNNVPAGYLRQVLWVKPKFWSEADAAKCQHVSYLVCRAELQKLEADAAERALRPDEGGNHVPLADGSPEQQQPSSTTSQT
jgi:hypothetical protein